jgi:Rrf2 family protein
MKISQKGLYALQAMMVLTRRYTQGAIRIRDIAYEENLPEKFLELILLELKNARIVESARGAKGGYRLRRPPSEIRLSEIIRLIDGSDRSRCQSQRALQSVSGRSGRGRQDSGAYDVG